ncbi:hypothetical protein L1987_05829 [Smallanthus sonchifolius]|uniref:Uncharacterized protein n=1 Tax=Smallanthus sonchifolius TaxID=185202 RepID=A0ACB9JWE9_9ASTR|nr:hypothetical protein L1987_05829 [Smallanthus sonchifolius]
MNPRGDNGFRLTIEVENLEVIKLVQGNLKVILRENACNMKTAKKSENLEMVNENLGMVDGMLMIVLEEEEGKSESNAVVVAGDGNSMKQETKMIKKTRCFLEFMIGFLEFMMEKFE